MSTIEDFSDLVSNSFAFVMVGLTVIFRCLIFLLSTFALSVYIFSYSKVHSESEVKLFNFASDFLFPKVAHVMNSVHEVSTLLILFSLFLIGLILTASEMILIQVIKSLISIPLRIMKKITKESKWGVRVEYLKPPKYVDSRMHNELTEKQLEHDNFHTVFEWQQFLNNLFWSLLVNYIISILLLVKYFKINLSEYVILGLFGISFLMAAYLRSKIMYELYSKLEGKE